MSRFSAVLTHATTALIAATACSAGPSPAARDSAGSSAAGRSPAPSAVVVDSSAISRPSRPDTMSTPMPVPAQPSFTRMLTQHTSGFDEPTELVIRDRAALETAWARVFNQVQGNPAPAVDFSREMVILVALGARRSGGYDIHVDAVAGSGNGAVVRYTATSPGEGCMTTQALTSPVDVVRTPRITGTVRFDRREVVQRC